MPRQDVNILINARDNASAQLNKAGGSLGAFGNSLQNLAGAAAAYFSFRQLLDVARESIRVFEEARRADLKRAAVLRATRNAAGLAADELKELAKIERQRTGLPLAELDNAQAVMLTFTNVNNTVFAEAMQLVSDMSAAFGNSLQGTTIQLGKALNDPVKGMSALADVGVSFTAEQQLQIRNAMAQNDLYRAQRVILDELKREVGGIGEATKGVHADLANAWDDFLGNLGEAITGSRAYTTVIDYIAFGIRNWKELLQIFALEGVRQLLSLANIFANIGGFVANFFTAVLPSLAARGAAVMLNMWDSFKESASDMIANLILEFQDLWDNVVARAKWAVDAIKALGKGNLPSAFVAPEARPGVPDTPPPPKRELPPIAPLWTTGPDGPVRQFLAGMADTTNFMKNLLEGTIAQREGAIQNKAIEQWRKTAEDARNQTAGTGGGQSFAAGQAIEARFLTGRSFVDPAVEQARQTATNTKKTNQLLERNQVTLDQVLQALVAGFTGGAVNLQPGNL